MEIFGLRIHVPWVLFHGLPSKLMITGELLTFYTRFIFCLLGLINLFVLL